MNLHVSSGSTIQTAVLDGTIYVRTAGSIVQVYDTQEERWSDPCRRPDSITKFAMVLNDDQLVLAGGVVVDASSYPTTYRCKNIVAVWNVRSKRWQYPYPPMPTPRSRALSIRHQQYLIFVGGVQYNYCSQSTFALTNVEILDTSRSQWFIGESLPEPCNLQQCVAIGDTLYLLGSLSSGQQLVFESSVPTLISLATSKSTATVPTWKKLPDTQLKFLTFVNYENSLVAVGGLSSQIISGLYAYKSDTNEWSNIGDLPTALYFTMCVVLPSKEFFVLSHNQEVYIGTADYV